MIVWLRRLLGDHRPDRSHRRAWQWSEVPTRPPPAPYDWQTRGTWPA
jgi:hypothetical protein